MKQPSRAARGLTLIELMLAVAITGILSSLAIYSFAGSRHRSACYGTIRELRILLAEARQKAQSSGLPVFLRFERLPERGKSLDGGGKIFARWERIGCADGQNDGWSNCPDEDCLDVSNFCAVDASGNLSATANRTCCESFGPWIEVADTLRIVSQGNAGNTLVKGDAVDNPLNRMCWSGTDSTRKVSVTLQHGMCAFDVVGADIADIQLACVDERDLNTRAASAMLEPKGDGVVSVDMLTGLSRIAVPKD